MATAPSTTAMNFSSDHTLRIIIVLRFYAKQINAVTSGIENMSAAVLHFQMHFWQWSARLDDSRHADLCSCKIYKFK